MTLRPGLLIVLLAVSACGAREIRSKTNQVEFLTRSGCVQTETMRARLDQAIAASGKALSYATIDLDTLPATDIRKGYPTPTILVDAVDLFDMPAPAPPLPEPT